MLGLQRLEEGTVKSECYEIENEIVFCDICKERITDVVYVVEGSLGSNKVLCYPCFLTEEVEDEQD